MLEEQVNRFLFDAPNKEHLIQKVFLVLGVCGACRRGDIYNLFIIDVTEKDNSFFVKIREPKNKKARRFALTGEFYDNMYKKL